MADKFQNKYRIPSARLQSWNYGLAASYFVTVCTDNRRHFFGEIIGEKMILSEIGKFVENEWNRTLSLRPDMNLEFDAFCVMPNHFHAIIIIGENEFNNRRDAMHRVSSSSNDDVSPDDNDAPSDDNDARRRDATHRVSTTSQMGNKFAPQSKNLGSIMRGFKSAVTISARSIDENFKWQTRFHDHIIRNDLEFGRIRKYIIENPKNWQNDKFYNNLSAT